VAPVVLRATVLLLALAFVAWRVLPRYRLPWAVPLLLVVLLLAVRTAGYLTGEEG
jgi:uncharacterized membrane protein